MSVPATVWEFVSVCPRPTGTAWKSTVGLALAVARMPRPTWKIQKTAAGSGPQSNN